MYMREWGDLTMEWDDPKRLCELRWFEIGCEDLECGCESECGLSASVYREGME